MHHMLLPICIALVLPLSGCSGRWVVHLASHHQAAGELRERNLGIGWRTRSAGRVIEFGAFSNSYGEQSVYALLGQPLTQLLGYEIRAEGGIASGYEPARLPVGRIAADIGPVTVGLLPDPDPTFTLSAHWGAR